MAIIVNLHGQVLANGAAIAQLGQYIERLAGRLEMADKHLTTDARVTQGVDLAIRGVRQGASEADLVEGYGMTRQEAALLRRLHGASSLADGKRAIS